MVAKTGTEAGHLTSSEWNSTSCFQRSLSRRCAHSRSRSQQSRCSVAPLRLHTVTLPADSAQAALDTLRANHSVTSVDANRTRDVSAVPSDPGVPSQWSLSRIGWDQLFGSVN